MPAFAGMTEVSSDGLALAIASIPVRLSRVMTAMKIATFNINNVNRRLPISSIGSSPRSPMSCACRSSNAPAPTFPPPRSRPRAMRRSGGDRRPGTASRSCRGEGRRSKPAPRCPAIRPTGRRATSKPRFREFSSAASTCRTAILSPAPSSTTSWPGSGGSKSTRRGSWTADVPVILCGDFNVAPTSLDIYPTTSWDDDALIHPKSRAAFARLVGQGWTDALRVKHPDERVYTFWHYMRHRWERDAGLRLDHLLLSPSLKPRLKGAGVDRDGAGTGGRERSRPGMGNAQRGRKVTATSLSPCGRGVGGSARGTPHPALRATFSRKGRRGSRRGSDS